MPITTKQVDYASPDDAADLIRLLSEYARMEDGDDAPDLSQLPDRLSAFPTAFSVLAYEAGDASQAVGLINCFFGFSTFAGKPLVNVHDVIVTQSCRGRGVSGKMLEAVEQIARDNDCCRLTLEVHADNASAIRAYEKYGFARDPAHPEVDSLFLRKSIA